MANHAREEPTRHRGDRFDRRARRRRRPGSSRSTTCIQVLALIAVIATVLPAGALAAGKGQVRSEAVTLGSESCPESAPDPEACTPPQEVGSFASTDGLRVVFNHPGDCSAIYLLLYRDGHKVGQTDAAKPGSSDEVTIAWPNDGEDHSLSAVGHGVAGECNTGEYLHAWSGNVEVLYTPPPEGVTIHGTVRIAGEEGIPAEATGVPGATVQVSGPGGKNTVAVSPTGAYSVHFKKAGSYAVLPRVPTAVTRGGRNPVNPESRTVTVALGDSATANFKVKDPLRVEIELSRDRVPADGEQSVRATVTATASGKPVKGLDVSIRPLEGGRFPVYQVPVPAAICLAPNGRRIWPGPNPGPGVETEPVDAVTDAKGRIELELTPGTVPGDFDLEVWAANSKGGLDTEHDILDVSKDAHLRVTPLEGGGTFEDALKKVLREESKISLPDKAGPLAAALGSLNASGPLADYAFAPIESTSGHRYEVVLVYHGAERIPFDGAKLLESTPGVVLSDNFSGLTNLAFGTLTRLARQGLPALPTVPNWLAGKSGPALEYPGLAGPLSSSVTDYTYFGYGYPGRRACS